MEAGEPRIQNLLLTLKTAAANLALDEALLEAAEVGACPGPLSSSSPEPSSFQGVLRLWEPKHYFVVLGRSSQPRQEVSLAVCARDGIPLLRRHSGGATIVAGPGCLMYAVVLKHGFHGDGADPARQFQSLPDIQATHQFVLGRMAQALSPVAPRIVRTGISDLAIPGAHSPGSETRLRKFSGNSLRCKRTHLLYHGTLLYNFDLARISRWLKMPPRHPEYRSARSHEQFLTNLPVSRDSMIQALLRGWRANQPLEDWPREQTARLAREKYHPME